MGFRMELLLDAGSGGRASARLINDLFFKYFKNDILEKMDDAAFIQTSGKLAVSTDSYTISPIFFPGGNIGSLAVHGTVNDVAMLGAKPKYLSTAFILEEGLNLLELEEIVKSMAEAANEAQVKIITGDTKVVPKGACDKIFINTTGIGEIIAPNAMPSGHNAVNNDVILLSGNMGDHGLTIMAARENFTFSSDIKSDSACLNHVIEKLVTEVKDIHVLRDPTRGGVATTLNEIAEQSQVRCTIYEEKLPINENVKAGSALLGLDPLYLANEGKFLCILPREKMEQALKIMHADPKTRNAVQIGEINSLEEGKKAQVVLQTKMGGKRLLSMLEGAPLPRIC